MYEQQLIHKITGGIGAIKRGEKTPKDAKLGHFLNMLKVLNIGQYEELLTKYKEAISNVK